MILYKKHLFNRSLTMFEMTAASNTTLWLAQKGANIIPLQHKYTLENLNYQLLMYYP